MGMRVRISLPAPFICDVFKKANKIIQKLAFHALISVIFYLEYRTGTRSICGSVLVVEVHNP